MSLARDLEQYKKPWQPENDSKPPVGGRAENGHRGLVYGSDPVDNASRTRGMRDPFHEKPSAEVPKWRQQKEEAQDDILKFKQEKMMQNFQREEEKKKDDGNRRRKFLETDVSPRDKPAYTTEPQKAPPTYSRPLPPYTVHKGHDLFIDTLGGPAGTVVRGEHGYPALQSMPDPRVGAYRSPGPAGTHEQDKLMDLANEERRIADQEHKIRELKKELEFLKSPPDQQQNGRAPIFDPRDADRPSNGLMNGSYAKPRDSLDRRPDFELERSRRPPEQRSLDLEHSRGGAGAPLRDDRGKAITRFPVTMVRDDYGASKIREEIPGKKYTLPDEENPIYNPWGRPGGGAPVKDRHGNVLTNTYGNFEKTKDSAEQRKHVRAKEVMLQDLRVGMEEQQRHKEQELRELKAPQGELADLVRKGQVGKPRRDPITGTLTNQHLGNSDVSKLKMNYQPKEEAEKKMYHEELTRLAEERNLNRQLEKMRDQQESNKHFERVDSLWGAFGGGAPKDRVVRKKVNLDNAIHHHEQFRETRSEDLHRHRPQYGLGMSPQTAARGDETLPDPRVGPAGLSKPVNPSYQKAVFDDDIRHRTPDATPRYLKNTTLSGSKHQFEYPTNRSTQPAQASLPPYATQGSAAY